MKPLGRFLKFRAPLASLALTVVLTARGENSLDPVLGTPALDVAPTVTATTPLASTPVVTSVAVGSAVNATFS
jgi:hypothetical protein